MFSGQACTPITRAYHCYHEYVFTLTVNEQQSCFYCLCFNNGLPPRKKNEKHCCRQLGSSPELPSCVFVLLDVRGSRLFVSVQI